MLTIAEVRLVLEPDMWAVIIDLADAFLQIPVHKSFPPYLAFQWQRAVYMYVGLPFGLCISPYNFTNLLGIPFDFCRQRLLAILPYVDDLLLVQKKKCSPMLTRQHIFSGPPNVPRLCYSIWEMHFNPHTNGSMVGASLELSFKWGPTYIRVKTKYCC